jgi:hypothetical protein
MDALTTTAIVVSQLAASGKWELVKALLRRGDRSGAAAEVDRAIADIKTGAIADIKTGDVADIRTGDVAVLDERTKEDVRFKVLALASIDERPLLSEVLGWQSAEKVGNNLTKATWALVAASAALVVATIVLVIITAIKH